MKRTYKHKKLTWVDLTKPSRQEVLALVKKFKLDPSTATEMLSPTPQPIIRVQKDYVHMTILFPSHIDKSGNYSTQEVDFVVGKDFLITAHNELVESIYEFEKVFETAQMLDNYIVERHAGYVWFYLLRQFYQHYSDEVDELNQRLQDIESEIFDGEESRMIPLLAITNRHLMILQRIFVLHEPIYANLAANGKGIFGKSFAPHLVAMQTTIGNLLTHIKHTKESIDDLRQTSELLVSARTSKVAKLFTVLAFLTVPVTLVADFVTLQIPGLSQSPTSVILIFVGALFISATLFTWFRYNKWM